MPCVLSLERREEIEGKDMISVAEIPSSAIFVSSAVEIKPSV